MPKDDGKALARRGFRPVWQINLFSPKAAWFSRDSRRLFVEDLGGFTDPRRIEVWDLSGPTPSPIAKGLAEGIAPDAGRLATAHFDVGSRWDPEAHDNSEVKVFDLPSSLPRLDFKETGVHDATISPDGKLLAMPSIRREFTGISGIEAILAPVSRFVGMRPNWLGGKRSSIAVRDIRFHDAATGRFVAAIDCTKSGPSAIDGILSRQQDTDREIPSRELRMGLAESDVRLVGRVVGHPDRTCPMDGF